MNDCSVKKPLTAEDYAEQLLAVLRDYPNPLVEEIMIQTIKEKYGSL